SGLVTKLPFGHDLFAGALLLYAAYGGIEYSKQLIIRWRESEAHSEIPLFHSWLLTAERLLNDTDEARRIVTANSGGRDKRLLAAVGVAIAGRARPEERFVAGATLFDVYSQSPWSRHVGEPLAVLIVRHWQEIARVPALLRAPKLAVPLLLDAINRPT